MRKTKLIVALGLGVLLAIACGTSPPADQPVTQLTASAAATGSAPVVVPQPTASATSSAAAPQPTSTVKEDPLDVAQVGVLSTDKPPACPADIKAECSFSDNRCVKPGFTCECYEMIDASCSGAAARPTLPGPRVWHCQPEDRKAKREDGCPFYSPDSGTACASEGKKCQYGGQCNFQGVTATCSKGRWSLPPMADGSMGLPPSSPPRSNPPSSKR